MRSLWSNTPTEGNKLVVLVLENIAMMERDYASGDIEFWMVTLRQGARISLDSADGRALHGAWLGLAIGGQ